MILSRIDKIFKKLYQTKGNNNLKTPVRLEINDLLWLCDESIKELKKDNTLLSLKAPIIIVGDIHGQFNDLLRILSIGELPPNSSYLFLGDYIDRGKCSIETLSFLLCMKVKYPSNIWLLRGNHETPEISRLYGFFGECATRYNQNLWDKFNDVFRYLPIAAIISDRIFCVHGGLSPLLEDLSQISSLKRPLDIPSSGLLVDLLWADPSPDHYGFQESERGTSYTFGCDVVDEFNTKYNFDLICRAHQVVDPGFFFPFYKKKNLLTLFSAPDYCEEFGNRGCIMKVDYDLKCTFYFIDPPPPKKKRFTFKPQSQESVH